MLEYVLYLVKGIMKKGMKHGTTVCLVLEYVLYLVKGIMKKGIKHGTTERPCIKPRKMDLLLMVRVPLQCVFPLFQNNSTSSLYGTTQGFGNHR